MFIGELFYPSWQPEPYLHLSQMAYQGLCGSGSNGEGGGSLSEGALRCANDLACALQRVTRTEEARTLFEAALRDAEAALGPNHMHTMSLMGNLASLYKDVGQLDAALPLFRACVERKVGGRLGRTPPPWTCALEAKGFRVENFSLGHGPAIRARNVIAQNTFVFGLAAFHEP